MSWQDRAACIGADADVFFPDVHGAAARAEARVWQDAKIICATCTVREECLSMALAEDIDAGIWGGLTPKERTRARKVAEYNRRVG